MLQFLPLLIALQSQPTEPVKASELKATSGPSSPRYPDPASGIGSDRMSMNMRRTARRSNVPGVIVPSGTAAISDQIQNYSGWKSYQVEVPARGHLKARVRADHEAWFYVTTVNRWGRMEEGMLQNKIYKGKPEATYTNPKDVPSTIYFIVDTRQADPSSDAYILELTWGDQSETKK